MTDQKDPKEIADSLLAQGAVPVGKPAVLGEKKQERNVPLAYRTGLSNDRKHVIIEFNQETVWLGLTPDKARQLALELRQIANQIEPKHTKKRQKGG